MKLPDTPDKKSQSVLGQLKLGLDLMRDAGYSKEAQHWSDVVRSKGLVQ
jgi:hypothetical protein